MMAAGRGACEHHARALAFTGSLFVYPHSSTYLSIDRNYIYSTCFCFTIVLI